MGSIGLQCECRAIVQDILLGYDPNIPTLQLKFFSGVHCFMSVQMFLKHTLNAAACHIDKDGTTTICMS